MAISDQKRAETRAFLDALFGRMEAGALDAPTVRAAVEEVVTNLLAGGRAKALGYMRSVIEGKGG